MRITLQILSFLGVLVFGGAFALSFLDPLLIERAAREVVRIEVERRVGEKIDTLSNSRIAGFGKRALQNTEIDIARTQRAIREEVPRKVADVVANMLNADCECRKRLVEYAQRAENEQVSSLTQARERLVGLAESAYASVTRNLLREFRIFAGSNAVAFALLGIIALVRRTATLQLVLPAAVSIGAVLITGGLYLFNQNWLHTIVFAQYLGLGYMVYLSCVALLLADVLLNRARVTTQIVNLALQAVGSAATAVPC
jgi:hypothetical protein